MAVISRPNGAVVVVITENYRAGAPGRYRQAGPGRSRPPLGGDNRAARGDNCDSSRRTRRLAMKVKAAVLRDVKQPWEVTELDLDGPKTGEVLIRYVASGLCHSDLHLTEGDLTPRFPIIGGHEGAGIIEEVGPGVTKVKPGDHVVCSFIPNCGVCRY